MNAALETHLKNLGLELPEYKDFQGHFRLSDQPIEWHGRIYTAEEILAKPARIRRSIEVKVKTNLSKNDHTCTSHKDLSAHLAELKANAEILKHRHIRGPVWRRNQNHLRRIGAGRRRPGSRGLVGTGLEYQEIGHG